MEHTARFFVGQVVHHHRFDYRGVVYDVDATFQGSDEWYDAVARSRPPKDHPWYHVLVDLGGQTTYVAERHLEPDADGGLLNIRCSESSSEPSGMAGIRCSTGCNSTLDRSPRRPE